MVQCQGGQRMFLLTAGALAGIFVERAYDPLPGHKEQTDETLACPSPDTEMHRPCMVSTVLHWRILSMPDEPLAQVEVPLF